MWPSPYRRIAPASGIRLPWWTWVLPTLVYPPLTMIALTVVWAVRRARQARNDLREREILAQQLSLELAQLRAGSQPSSIVAHFATIARRRGVPVATLVESYHRSIDASVRHTRATHAALAGPRATAWTLTLLPLGCIGLGTAMGAQPVHILLHHPIGQLCALIGAALCCGGFITTQLIIGKAMQ